MPEARGPKPASKPTTTSSSPAPTPTPVKKRGKKKGKGRKALGLTAADGPARMCIVCRESGGPHEHLRFARAPDGAVGFDVKAKLPGRGAWVCAKIACLDKAADAKHGGFARAFDAPVVFDGKALRADVAAGLLAEVTERLGLLRRQGALITGRDEVVRAVERGALMAIGVAADLSANSRHELAERAPGMTQITLPRMEAIGAAIGTRDVGVVGIPKREGQRLMAAATKWAPFAASSTTTTATTT